MSNVTDNSMCTYEAYGQRTLIISGVFLPPLVSIGIISNIIDIWIFSQKSKRKVSVNQFLLATSVTDMCILINSFSMFSVLAWADYFESPTMVHTGNIWSKWSFPFGLIFQTASVWLTSAMTSFKFIGVCFPFVAQRFATVGRAKCIIVTIVILSVLSNISRFFEIQLVECLIEKFNETIYLMAPTDFRNHPTYHTYFMGYGYTIFMFLLPFSLLIAMNTAIAIAAKRKAIIKRKSDRSADVNFSANGPTRNSFKKKNKTTVMLVVIVFSFLLSNILALISNLVEMFMELTLNQSPELTSAYSAMVDFSNLFIVANCSLNTWIYYSFSQEYRKQVKELFHKLLRKLRCVTQPQAQAV